MTRGPVYKKTIKTEEFEHNRVGQRTRATTARTKRANDIGADRQRYG